MAKVQIKSEKLTPFGGIFSIMEQFDALLAQTIDSSLGLRCTMFGYQYSEILRSLILRNGLRHHVGMYWTFTQTTMLMTTCSRQTLVKGHAFLVKPAYYLKSLYGVRGFCVYDVSVVQEICTIKWILSLCKQNHTKPYRLRIWGIIAVLVISLVVSYILCETKQNDADILILLKSKNIRQS